MGCVLNGVVEKDHDGPITMIHPSLYDFLTNKGRCTDDRFYVDTAVHAQIMVSRCLKIMNSVLGFDFCCVEERSLLNNEIVDLQGKIEKHIPEELDYACRFFTHHLLNEDELIKSALNDFLDQKFLDWIYAMSLMGCSSDVFQSLEQLAKFIQVGELCDLI
jgi:hypothetical protein